jgi:hypothetical protein
VASGSGEPEGHGVEATRSRFLYRKPTIYEEKAKVNDDLLGVVCQFEFQTDSPTFPGHFAAKKALHGEAVL